MGNKYQEEARLLVNDLEGTKWSDLTRSSERPAREHARSWLAAYVRAKPMASLLTVAAFAFAYRALRSISARVTEQ